MHLRHERCPPVKGLTGIVDKWMAVVDNVRGLGKTLRTTGGLAGMTGERTVGPGEVCVDWHRCATPGMTAAGEMWTGYPQVVRGETGVVTPILAVIPEVPSTTARTDVLSLL